MVLPALFLLKCNSYIPQINHPPIGGRMNTGVKFFKIQILLLIALALFFITANSTFAEVSEDMVAIKAGEFIMGTEGASNKTPHTVFLDEYYIDRYEVNQKNFEELRNFNPSKFVASDHPVEQVTWFEANAYCNKLGKRLPTEAEWEKAARGHSTSNFFWGDNQPETFAWYDENSEDHTHPVGLKKPNSFGLYDISGNVWEWTSDWYGKHYYEESPKRNPKGPESGEERVIRGGSWYSSTRHLQTVTRYWSEPNIRNSNIGFRCVKTP